MDEKCESVKRNKGYKLSVLKYMSQVIIDNIENIVNSIIMHYGDR